MTRKTEVQPTFRLNLIDETPKPLGSTSHGVTANKPILEEISIARWAAACQAGLLHDSSRSNSFRLGYRPRIVTLPYRLCDDSRRAFLQAVAFVALRAP